MEVTKEYFEKIVADLIAGEPNLLDPASLLKGHSRKEVLAVLAANEWLKPFCHE